MILSVVRVLIAFGLACIAGALVQLGFASPNDLLTDDPDRLSWSLDQALLAATHSAVFSAPFALVAAAIGEWQTIRSWVYYALAGIAISIAGFIALYSGESSGTNSIVNQYAATAYLISGLAGGFIYWLFSGRFAGDPLEGELNAGTPSQSSPSQSTPGQDTSGPSTSTAGGTS